MRNGLGLVTVAIVSVCTGRLEGHEKAAIVRAELAAITQIVVIAEQSHDLRPSQQTVKRIKDALATFSTPEQLAQAASILHALSGDGHAEDQYYDHILDLAMWSVLDRLAQAPGPTVGARLEVLRASIGRDGHGSELMRELIRSQRALKEGPKPMRGQQ